MPHDARNPRSKKLGDSERQNLDEFKKQLSKYWAGVAQDGGAWWTVLDAKPPVNGERAAHGDQARRSYLDRLGDPVARRAILEGRFEAVNWSPEPTAVPAKPGTPPKPSKPATSPEPIPPPSKEEQIWLQLRASYTEVDFVATNADQIIQQGLRAVDDTIALQAELRKDVVRIANDPSEQAGLFLHLAWSIQGVSPFETRVPNPEPVAGEQALPMRYSDPWQPFFAAPWTGFPIGFQGQGADFSAANLIPIVDIVGGRYQWSASRLADFRAAFGFTALTFTTPVAVKGEAEQETKALVRPAVEVNLSLANFKVGAAYAAGFERDGLEQKERFRLLVGADLYKLISGGNVDGTPE